MRCSFCGRDFDEASAREGCSRCTLFGGCRNLKCPHCGYETPEEPAFIKWLRNRSGKGDRDHDKRTD